MEDKELMNIWKAYDQKLDQVLSVNKQLVHGLTRGAFDKKINRMKWPKRMLLLIGVPYTLLLFFVTFIGVQAGAVFVSLGFGAIALIMTIVLIAYSYQLYLISEINSSDDIVAVQQKLSSLKLSSFNTAKLIVLQLPFWSICWMSYEALKNSMLVYGGVNLIVFLGLCYLTYWLYQQLDIQNLDSRVNQFFFSGVEWDPIIQSGKILEQLREYE